MPNKDSTTGVQLERQRLKSLINSMADGVIAIDEHCKVVLYNAAALNILDVNTDVQNLYLRNILKLYTKDNQPVAIEEIVHKTKIPTFNRDFLLKYSDASVLNLYLSIAPVHLGYGQSGQSGFVLVMRDITKEKSLEEERDEFISVVSHELRTPIAIAEGNISNAQFMTDKTNNLLQIKQALNEAHDQIMFLSEMVNDLATLSRAERGRITIEVKSFNAHQLVDNLVKSYQTQAEENSVKLIKDVDPRLELLRSSELYVREILQNFITNALKYTLTGSITVGAKPQNGGVEFWVTDTGIGIAKNERQKIFNKFFRSEDYRTKMTKGTGLGLYITKKLAQLLKAEIDVSSELNKGSTFKCYIPNLPN